MTAAWVGVDPGGLCECGCGKRTPLARQSDTKRGYVKGQPVRFVPGHNARLERQPLDERFWAKVERDGPVPPHVPSLGRCWIWTGSRGRRGYGQIGLGKRSDGLGVAHRVSWEMANGPIPPGMWVLHRCDNPPCVRPDHLFLGNNQANVADMWVKGRQSPPPVGHGEANGQAKLTAANVEEIRSRLTKGERQTKIAADYGVSNSMISLIHRGRKWAL